MHKADDASPSIILASGALLVKILITFEAHGIFGSKFVNMYFNIVHPLASKTVSRIHRASFWPVELFW